jgi:hypothetical protein
VAVAPAAVTRTPRRRIACTRTLFAVLVFSPRLVLLDATGRVLARPTLTRDVSNLGSDSIGTPVRPGDGGDAVSVLAPAVAARATRAINATQREERPTLTPDDNASLRPSPRRKTTRGMRVL